MNRDEFTQAVIDLPGRPRAEPKDLHYDITALLRCRERWARWPMVGSLERQFVLHAARAAAERLGCDLYLHVGGCAITRRSGIRIEIPGEGMGQPAAANVMPGKVPGTRPGSDQVRRQASR